MAHRCPSWCHRCPDMPHREIMPGCFGTILSTDPHSFARCTCRRPNPRANAIEKRIFDLEVQIDELRKQLAKAKE